MHFTSLSKNDVYDDVDAALMMLSDEERKGRRRKWKLYHLSAFMNFHFALFYGITRCFDEI
jgi:hypothetical protein